jgi:replicative DNA helicase
MCGTIGSFGMGNLGVRESSVNPSPENWFPHREKVRQTVEDITEKWVPISIEAEQGLLGAILLNNDVLLRVSDILQADHFGEGVHGYIFDVAQKLITAGKLASPLTIKSFIPDQMLFEGMTTQRYLVRLAAEATTVINARDYALIIRDLAKRRDLMQLGDRLCRPEPTDVLDLASSAIEEIDTIVADLSNSATRGVSMPGAMALAVDAAAKAFQANGAIIGIPSKITKLDRKLLGFTRGDLVIMAGRPGMGKSAVMVTMSRNMAEAGYHGIIFSQEMSEVQIGQRMIADKLFNQGPIPYFNFRSGRFEEHQFKRIQEAAEELALLPIQTEPQPAQTVSQMAARARQAKRRGKLDFIFVDHLGITKPSSRYQNRVHQIGEMTGAFKALAKELDCVVIVLSQLSRALESREDKRPLMNDLRDSGDIEQDADVIIMLFREMYYLQRREPPPGTPEHAAWQTACVRAENRLEMIVEKQRSGPTGTVEVFCNIGCNAIRDLDEHEILATAAYEGAPEHEPILL